jgi:hypothetical protein
MLFQDYLPRLTEPGQGLPTELQLQNRCVVPFPSNPVTHRMLEPKGQPRLREGKGLLGYPSNTLIDEDIQLWRCDMTYEGHLVN